MTTKGSRLSRLAILLREAGSSRLGWLLACFHAGWFFIAIAQMSPPSPGMGAFFDQGGWSSATLFAGRPFHFHYESLVLKLLILADLPSAFAMLPLDLVLASFLKLLHFGFYVGSYLSAVLVLFGATCQWLLVGSKGERWLASRTWGTWPCRQVHRWSGILIAIIVIATFVLTPVINERSRGLGFRHGGISFH